MKSTTVASLLAVLCLGACLAPLAGCTKEEAAEPSLCLVPGSEDPATVRAAECPFRFSVIGGETFFVVHELPEEVILNEPLRITIETPCERVEIERRHVAGRVVLPVIAPPGAGCALEVTATIANSQARTTALPVPPLCDSMETLCPSDDGPDAGSPADDPEGEADAG